MSLKGEESGIRSHPFFEPLEWDRAEAFATPPPYIPGVKDVCGAIESLDAVYQKRHDNQSNHNPVGKCQSFPSIFCLALFLLC
jgi:hypothetical protein